MCEHVVILGDGAMATVCSILLHARGHKITLWGALPQGIQSLQSNRENRRFLPGISVPDDVNLTADETACFNGATLALSAIPTQYLRSVWARLTPQLPAGLPVVSVTKGIENNTLLRPTQMIQEMAQGRVGSVAVLSGPNIAGEVARRMPATAVAASADEDLARRVQAAFSTQWFRVYTNIDLLGVELAGAVKNVIAIAAGIIDGMQAGNNAKAALVTRGLVEITRLGVAMGANESTFHGLAGLGDLITTCVSPEGRNRSVGERIGRGEKLTDIISHMNSVAEGVPTTRSVMELARRHGIEMPITEAVHAVLFDARDPRDALSELMSREAKPERT